MKKYYYIWVSIYGDPEGNDILSSTMFSTADENTVDAEFESALESDIQSRVNNCAAWHPCHNLFYVRVTASEMRTGKHYREEWM